MPSTTMSSSAIKAKLKIFTAEDAEGAKKNNTSKIGELFTPKATIAKVGQIPII